jgi:hypothetical protein
VALKLVDRYDIRVLLGPSVKDTHRKDQPNDTRTRMDAALNYERYSKCAMSKMIQLPTNVLVLRRGTCV